MKTVRTYIIGFGLSVVLTLAAFWLVHQHLLSNHIFPSHTLLAALLVLFAIAQLFVQLIFFLHVGQEQKPRWNLAALVFALIIVAILVGGTLWIMHNLEHGQMSNADIFTEENIFPHTP